MRPVLHAPRLSDGSRVYRLLIGVLLSFALFAGGCAGPKSPPWVTEALPAGGPGDPQVVGVGHAPEAGQAAANARAEEVLDGYGNPCDTGFDGDVATRPTDVSAIFAAAGAASTDPEFDTSCDAAIGLDDLSRTLAGSTP